MHNVSKLIASVLAAGLMLAGGILLVLIICNRLLIRHALVYLTLGICLWLAVFGSGVHATVAGVLLAMTVPVRTRIDEDEFIVRAEEAVGAFKAASDPHLRSVISNNEQQEALHALEGSVDEVQSPLMKMEHALHAPVAFVIMPLFALANAGVRLDAAMFATVSWRVVLGVLVGLIVGKSIGITLFSWAAVRAGFAAQPAGVSWKAVKGVAWLAGIGFTMSLFVAGLAYGSGPLLDSAKVGVIAASVLAGAVGYLVLRTTTADPHGLPSVEPDTLVAVGTPEADPDVERQRADQ